MRNHWSIDAMLSPIWPRRFCSQCRNMDKILPSLLAHLPDCCHNNFANIHSPAQPFPRENNSFRSIFRHVVHGISTGAFTLAPKSKDKARQHAKRCHVTLGAPSRYGCTTIMVNQQCYDIPTLAHDSGLRMVRKQSLSLR